MGGKSSGKIPVTSYYMSVQLALCHGVVDSINFITFNDKRGWDGNTVPDAPPPPSNGPLTARSWKNIVKYTNGGGDMGPMPTGLDDTQIEITATNNGQLSSFNAAAYIGGTLAWDELVQTSLGQFDRVPRTRVIHGVGSVEESNSGGESTNYTSFPTIVFDPNDGNPYWPKAYTGADDSIPYPVTQRNGTAENLVINPKSYVPPTPPQPPGPITADGTITINQPNLFGGLKEQGGVAGLVHVMMGTLSQLMPANLASKFGRTPQTMPAYRGVATMFFYGGQGQKGFYWSTNNAYMPDVAVNVTRIPVGLNPAIARIGGDANPAHIIFESMTNFDWGMGAANTAFDLTNFNAAAQTLYNENFGLSLLWSDQMTMEDFVKEVLDHIEASLFIHPRTGLFTLKLIRDDYNVADLPEYTPDNAYLKNFQRKGWGETINELTVTYKNPDNEEDVSFTIQNPANIAMQGAVVTDSRNYYGIRNPTLAAKVADRDLRAASAPLSSLEIEMDRTAWSMVPGDVVLITWPEYGLNKLPMRVGPVDYGKRGTPRVRASLVEDVFFLPASDSYYIPPTTEWTDDRETANVIEPTKIFTLPLYFAIYQPGAPSEDDVTNIAYPEVAAGVLGSSYMQDAQDYTLYSEQADTTGTVGFRPVGVRPLIGYGINVSALTLEAVSYTQFAEITPKGGPIIGNFALIGNVGDADAEVVLLESYEQNQGWKLRRGALDTVPHEWPAQTPVWFIDPYEDLNDGQIRYDGDTPAYKMCMRTSLNTLDISYAPEVDGLLNGRPHYPFRPANVRLNTMLWGAPVITGGTAALTWSTRSRLQETSVVLTWTDDSVAPETGQTTKVTWTDDQGNVITTSSGLTGTTTALGFASVPGPSVKYKIESERDDLASLQFVERTFDVAGWGMNYGNYYGGA